MFWAAALKSDTASVAILLVCDTTFVGPLGVNGRSHVSEFPQICSGKFKSFGHLNSFQNLL
jgi:hypothetical protein